jgi:outer membrane protease
LDPVSKYQFPETKERSGYFVGFVDNVGDALTFKILKNDLVTVLYRSVVRSAADANHYNRRVSFKSDVQESLKLLDTKPSLSFVWKDCHHKFESRNANHWNKRVSFKSDVQEPLKLLDTKPSLSFVWKDSHHKHESRKTNNDLSNRTTSKADYTDQHIGSRTRSKMYSVNNLSVQNLFFPLHDAILFQGYGKSQEQDL